MKNIEKYRHMRPVEYGYHLKGVGGTLKLPPPPLHRGGLFLFSGGVFIFLLPGENFSLMGD